jgi:hypothetical protein
MSETQHTWYRLALPRYMGLSLVLAPLFTFLRFIENRARSAKVNHAVLGAWDILFRKDVCIVSEV